MQNKIYKNSGYIGLLFLLGGILIMGLLVWKLGFSVPKVRSNPDTTGQKIEFIERAEVMKENAESRDRAMLGI